jgi:uncharacterized damage-inducible protein DinB
MILIELFAHQAWADAEHWRAILASPGALQDKVLRERLHHVHLVQHAFAGTLSRTKVDFHEVSHYDDAALLAFGRGAHDALMAFWATVDLDKLAETVTIPWFKDPPLTITVEQALAQVVMHSQHHRGQNAVRLRELGFEPPMVDLIAWYWKGRPEPHWPE